MHDRQSQECLLELRAFERNPKQVQVFASDLAGNLVPWEVGFQIALRAEF